MMDNAPWAFAAMVAVIALCAAWCGTHETRTRAETYRVCLAHHSLAECRELRP